MKRFDIIQTTSLLAGVVLILMNGAGCSQLPGTPKQQGAAIGAAGGAAAGAVVASHNRGLGALIGGLAGAAGGYLIGANSDRILHRDTSGAEQAARNAQSRPATPDDAMRSPTADLNNDGFVTMDEVIAMRGANFSDQQILERLRATGQVFELTPEQQSYLREQGISQYVVDQMLEINRDVRDRVLSQQPPPVIGQPVQP